MRAAITGLADELLAEVRYWNAARGGGTAVERLPIQRGTLAFTGGAPGPELDAIVACSDLQGVVRGRDGATELLGVSVADVLEELAYDGLVPPVARTGVLLAGDLYSVPEANKRGGHGDVADVWRAFAARFAWVAGVAGNHDDVTDVPAAGANVHLLDGHVVELDGVRVGGVGRIVGNPEKRGRRAEREHLALLDRVLDASASIVVLHEGPPGEAAHQRGNDRIRDTLEAGDAALTVCGHDHWAEPLSAVPPRGQVLNVDARVVVLVIAR